MLVSRPGFLRLTRSRVGSGGLQRLAEKLPSSLKSLWLDVGSCALAQKNHKNASWDLRIR